MLVGAIHACERYYPAFQFVVWAGKTAAEAMSAAMFDTAGRGVGLVAALPHIRCRPGERSGTHTP